jgi:hypothetical protein
MERQDRDKKRPDPQSRPEHRDSRERTVAPPIEREHETQKGALEEDEKREHERQ